jgi:hypothetical protein
MDDTRPEDAEDVTAQDFGFVLAGVISLMYRHGVRIDWEDAYIDQDFDDLLNAARVLHANPILQEQIVSDAEIVAELYQLAVGLREPEPDFERASIATRRLWRAVKPFARR